MFKISLQTCFFAYSEDFITFYRQYLRAFLSPESDATQMDRTDNTVYTNCMGYG